MRLTLQSQKVGDVVVIRCQGRIVAGAEVEALEAEVSQQTKLPGSRLLSTRKVLLNLAETVFIDSSGMGALVHMLGVLRATDCDLRLCELTPFVLRVLQMTKLVGVLPNYSTEAEALAAFASTGMHAANPTQSSQSRVVCVDTSNEVLAYISAILQRQGYEVLTTKYAGEAVTLVIATSPKLVICGPGMMRSPVGEESVEKMRKAAPEARILVLSEDFSTTEAGDAAAEFVAQVETAMNG